MLPTDLITRLTDIVGADGVVHRDEDLLVYECDHYTLARKAPAAAVLPRNTPEAVEVTIALAEHQVPVVPRGGSMNPDEMAVGDGMSADAAMAISSSAGPPHPMSSVRATAKGITRIERSESDMVALPLRWGFDTPFRCCVEQRL